ncbi:MAG: trypsin-like peptidase domain-containing protein, partial [Methanobrevibacter sp.]|uniref:trypsin-like peptidase domain-containing protein n=1 Tax=Methanobrevibacter sp. TaxID=66852 RepID=UPI0025D5DA45
MKRILILLGILFVCTGLFAEAHECSMYAEIEKGNLNNISFIPDWFEHLELANNNENYGYDEEFLREHAGRVGKIVFMNSSTPVFGCSGTLIGNNYFLTAAHCASAANVGVLFGYQKADLENSDNDEYDDDDEISDDDSDNMPEYPRVSLKGYLNNDEKYIRYDEDYPDIDVEYHDFDQHPAYFRIAGDNPDDGTVENGWTMSDDDSDKVDYAIYKLHENAQQYEPEKVEDPWPWRSVNNRDDGIPEKIWRLLDNTNGKRGWARVNTDVQQHGSPLYIIGHPWVANIFDGQDTHPGIKVVNAGSVADGQARGLSKEYEEDLLIFKDADIQKLHSGSPVIDYSGRVAGVVVWFGCAPGGAWDKIEEDVTLQNKSAENFATPMWRICKVSQIIKNAAKDMNCNGRIDWWDILDRFKGSIIINPVIIDNFLIDRFGIHPIPLDLKNYRYDETQQKVVTETREIPANTYQVAWSDNGNFFYVVNQNNSYYLFKNGASLGTISNYPQLNG